MDPWDRGSEWHVEHIHHLIDAVSSANRKFGAMD